MAKARGSGARGRPAVVLAGGYEPNAIKLALIVVGPALDGLDVALDRLGAEQFFARLKIADAVVVVTKAGRSPSKQQ